ncbi:hypothetical protein VE04_00444 [Pseudogymnoascus sp. 24MN13]|nr:hypothetical protein VE04_00444 [Pseudogymnoascus sp. 24MN13]
MNLNTLTSCRRRSVRPRAKVLWTSDWVCKSCRTNSVAVRPRARFSSTKTPMEKPYYITTPIFYVNAAPHVGHLYTMVLTDILKRFQQLKGRPAILCTGTDEHGMKIQQAASLSDEDPKEFCDRVSETFKQLAARADLSYDHFIRTTDPDHKEAVQHFWQLLQERGYIYEKKHEGWYSVSDETFYPSSAIEKRLDPATGRTFMAAQETGKEVEWTAETNYHFRLSALKEPLLEFYKQNPNFVVPATRMRDIERRVAERLDDVPVSLLRPPPHLGHPGPERRDANHLRLARRAGKLHHQSRLPIRRLLRRRRRPGRRRPRHGKDIMRFHCIYWPAFLLALDLPLPKQVLTHAHWTLGHSKMAKSTGNVVNPFFAMDRFGVDAMRFYLAHDGGITDDADYANANIVERYRKCLSGGLGNLLQRVTGTKVWSVSEAVEAAAKGEFEVGENPIEAVHGVGGVVDGHFKELNPRAGLHEIMRVIYDYPETKASACLTAPGPPLQSSSPSSRTSSHRRLPCPRDAAKSHISKPAVQPSRRHSTINSNLRHPRSEQPHTRRTLATAPAPPDSPTSAPKYVNPFLTRPITIPLRVTIHPKSSPENVSPRTPTAPAPRFPDAPFPQLNTHPFGVPPTVHVLADWPYGPILETMSPRTRRFAIGGTDADGSDMKIYRPRLDRDTYLECLPPASRVVVCCTSSACGAICELDGRAGACRRRSAPVKDAARWERYMWSCEGCGEDMEMQVLKESEGNSPTGTANACYKKDEQDA